MHLNPKHPWIVESQKPLALGIVSVCIFQFAYNCLQCSWTLWAISLQALISFAVIAVQLLHVVKLEWMWWFRPFSCPIHTSKEINWSKQTQLFSWNILPQLPSLGWDTRLDLIRFQVFGKWNPACIKVLLSRPSSNSRWRNLKNSWCEINVPICKCWMQQEKNYICSLLPLKLGLYNSAHKF